MLSRYLWGFALAVLATAASAAISPIGVNEMTPQGLLVLGRVSRPGGGLGSIDPVEAARVAGAWAVPRLGDAVALPDGKTVKWEGIVPDKDGAFPQEPFAGGYEYWSVPSAEACVAVLTASGHSMVYVNGEPRAGDVYGDGFVRLPVLLQKGDNGFLFKAGRGSLSIRLRLAPVAAASLSTDDATLPDIHAGAPVDTWGAVVVMNASQSPLTGLTITSTLPGGRPVATAVPRVEPLSVRKVGFRIKGPARKLDIEKVRLRLTLTSPGGRSDDGVDLRVRKAGQTYKQTFISRIDGSVQYFAVNPAAPGPRQLGRPVLVLSLHGASVQASGQADAYGAKSWATLVAPTNRRPYGYDWEDWGRMDAVEVLDIAQREMKVDAARTYLVGHSMGGHGAWQIGALYPDRFAAIAPSAGWISAYTYAGAKKDDEAPVQDVLRRSAATMDTLSMARNYASEGVYILHGTDDDNVPVTEARKMRDVLAGFHHDFVFHEEPGQGHWWDLSDEPGADCVDWAPMWDFLAKHTLPPVESVRQVDFVTVNPGVSARCWWATVEAQEHAGEPSEVHIQCDPQTRRYKGTTTNVTRLAIDLQALLPGKGVLVALDDQKLTMPDLGGRTVVRLRREGNRWSFTAQAPPEWKGPERNGPFRAAFDHRMQFVYGTGGTREESAWAFAKARYDAETFWYRGNGSVDVLPDTVFDPSKDRDRSVILYGNADTNRAWAALLSKSPVQVRHGAVRAGDRELRGDDLACLFLQPRPGSAVSCVGVVSGTGIRGMRVSNSLPYLQPMVGYPDVLLVSSDILTHGVAGVRAAGFFGPDWGVTTGEIAWQEGLE